MQQPMQYDCRLNVYASRKHHSGRSWIGLINFTAAALFLQANTCPFSVPVAYPSSILDQLSWGGNSTLAPPFKRHVCFAGTDEDR